MALSSVATEKSYDLVSGAHAEPDSRMKIIVQESCDKEFLTNSAQITLLPGFTAHRAVRFRANKHEAGAPSITISRSQLVTFKRSSQTLDTLAHLSLASENAYQQHNAHIASPPERSQLCVNLSEVEGCRFTAV